MLSASAANIGKLRGFTPPLSPSKKPSNPFSLLSKTGKKFMLLGVNFVLETLLYQRNLLLLNEASVKQPKMSSKPIDGGGVKT